MSKENMKTSAPISYEAPESTVFRVTAERNILSGSPGTIEEPIDEPPVN